MGAPAPSPVDFVLRRIRSLKSRAGRDRAGCFWIEGVRNFLHAGDGGYPIEAIVSSRILLKHGGAARLARQLSADGRPRWHLSPEQFRSISTSPHASGIGAIVRQHRLRLDETHLRPGLCWLVVEEISSPGNLGTILRTANVGRAHLPIAAFHVKRLGSFGVARP